ncbi:integrator complex subunit 8-like isoform X1 [Hydractinia symbiolongicarpus]|uniref:integrator complex subunit 8-like isoform X1 n=2 Tax=Hydractinia symbiolongicarpus TaxID=13093 RepID=UPI00254DD243|nr:integrator complex subunit 8-like isoform X1 [Hydractinia symbiolongicarpus]
MAKKYSYFEFLFDQSGAALRAYLNDPNKDPPVWELCKQFIEKSLAIATSASLSQGATETELKVYEAQRIWQPLCLAMTLLSHLKWDLDVIQKKIPLHLQQILMEELLKGYGISQVPKPEDFDINKIDKRDAMVQLIYNRWVVRTITKYEELKEKDLLPNNISNSVREAKENQEQQIFMKIKEYRNLSVDILEKAIYLNNDLEVPLPMPRLVTATEIIPQRSTSPQIKVENNTVVTTEGQIKIELKKEGVTMTVPPELEVTLPISSNQAIVKICYDLGCYYFCKELFNDASRAFKKAFNIINEDEELKNEVDYKQMSGYHRACLNMSKETHSTGIEISDLCYRLEESSTNEYKDILTILKEDNISRDIPLSQRQNIEKELYLLDKKDDLFSVCTLNFIRNCLDGSTLSIPYCQSLQSATKKELKLFLQMSKTCLNELTSEMYEERLKDGVRLALQFLSDDQRHDIVRDKNIKFFSSNVWSPKKKRRDETIDDDGMIDSPEKQAEISEQDERISLIVKLKGKLMSCFNPERIKDILFDIHDISPEKSHVAGYECVMYHDIFKEIRDLLMFDTVHVCVTKARQLTLQKKCQEALPILNTCVDTLHSYAIKASPGFSISRVKNLLHHELLWTELNFAEYSPDSVNLQETMRRSKACIKHSQQDPPPSPHIYQAIVIHLLNSKENQFLTNAGSNFDVTVVDYLQLGYHLSSVVCGLQRGVEVLRAAAKGLWDAVLKIVGDCVDAAQGPPPVQSSSRARGPVEDQHMWTLHCFISKDDFVSLVLKLKDDTLLSLLLSCLTSLLCVDKDEINIEIKDSYSHLWPSVLDSEIKCSNIQILSVLKPLCDYCIQQNSRNITWLRTIGDVHLVEGNYREAMKCYLELGSITTSFFSRPVPYSVWDEKIYRNMIKCCQKQKAYTQVVLLCQFTDPIEYDVAFEAILKRSSDDGMDAFYDCLWDVNILEYLIHSHHKRGEIEKRKLAIKVLGQPELNCRCSSDILQQGRDTRKTKFLRTLVRMYWE